MQNQSFSVAAASSASDAEAGLFDRMFAAWAAPRAIRSGTTARLSAYFTVARSAQFDAVGLRIAIRSGKS